MSDSETPWAVACQAPLSKNTGVSCHALLHGIFPTQGSNLCLMSPALEGGFFTTSATWEVLMVQYVVFSHLSALGICAFILMTVIFCRYYSCFLAYYKKFLEKRAFGIEKIAIKMYSNS